MPAHPSCARIALPLLLPALAGIYISQTLLTALTTQALPTLMREAGASLQVVGLTALWWLPWGLKFLWAPWVERLRLPAHRPARRSRPLLLGTQWTLAALLLALGAAGMAGGARALALTGGAWVAAALLLAALAASVGDVVCDGFAIDQLPRKQHGWGNVVQVGGSYIGAMLGSGGFLLAVQEPPRAWAHGPSDAEPDAPESAPTDAPENGVCRWPRPSLLYALRRPPVRQGLLRVVLCMAGLRLTMGLLGPLLLDAGMDMSQLGWLLGAFSLLAGLARSLAGGLLVRRARGCWRSRARPRRARKSSKSIKEIPP